MGSSYLGEYEVGKNDGIVTMPSEFLETIKNYNKGNKFIYACPLVDDQEISIVYLDAHSYEILCKDIRDHTGEIFLDKKKRNVLRPITSKMQKTFFENRELRIPSDLDKIVDSEKLVFVGCGGIFELWTQEKYRLHNSNSEYEKAAEGLEE